MKIILLFIIRIYQATISRDHGLFRGRYPYGYCPFYPTCSQYAYESISKYGVIKGVSKSFLRVIRCRPGVVPSIDLA